MENRTVDGIIIDYDKIMFKCTNYHTYYNVPLEKGGLMMMAQKIQKAWYNYYYHSWFMVNKKWYNRCSYHRFNNQNDDKYHTAKKGRQPPL